MNSRTIKTSVFAFVLALAPMLANATPTYWATNGHYYEVIPYDGMDWNAANSAAMAMTHLGASGHLATLTSPEENAFVDSLRVASGSNKDGFADSELWVGGSQPAGLPATDGWVWVNGEGPITVFYWLPGEPNDAGGSESYLAIGWSGMSGWNDEANLDGIFGYVVEFDVTTKATVQPGNNVLIFNQANVPGSNNPLTAAYQEVLPGGGENVSIACCRVLDTREGAGPKKLGYFLPTTFDIGAAIADTNTNPTCAGMPYVAPGTALLYPWQRVIPESKGLMSTHLARPTDGGVCVIQSDVKSKGVVFSEEDARNVLGYKINCAEKDVSYRPFSGGVATDPTEADSPFAAPWTAECDESRSTKKYSNNVLVLNLRHDTKYNPTLIYLSGLNFWLLQSLQQVKLEGCVDPSFINDLQTLSVQAGFDILRRRGEAAVQKLDDATRLAMLIDGSVPVPAADPYGTGGSECAGNPKGLFVGRLMSLKFATCSELVQSGSGKDAQAPAACAIAGDILNALPPLPSLPVVP
jgi:hypothetical protein